MNNTTNTNKNKAPLIPTNSAQLPDVQIDDKFDRELELMFCEIELGFGQGDDEAGIAVSLSPRPLRDGHHARPSELDDLLVCA